MIIVLTPYSCALVALNTQILSLLLLLFKYKLLENRNHLKYSYFNFIT